MKKKTKERKFAYIIFPNAMCGDSATLEGKTYVVGSLLKIKGLAKVLPVARVEITDKLVSK